MTRDALIANFLARHGFASATGVRLAQDASFRRYLRLIGGPRPAVLMDAPMPEDVRPFLRIAAHLAGIGLSVPAIIAADPEHGLVLAEDLGDTLLLGAEVCPSHEQTDPPWSTTVVTEFDAAIAALVAIQRAAPPPGLPLWDAPAMIHATLDTLLNWWWPAAFDAPAPAAARDDFTTALVALLHPLAEGPRCFVHRDYFAGNLLLLPDRFGPRRIGILDFQSAALGHPAYDLASLLQDSRRDIPQSLADRAVSRYLDFRLDLDRDAFRAAYAICAAQRHLRIACQWVRLALRDGRRNYLTYGPCTWRLLAAALYHPAVTPLTAVMDRWIPPDKRANPQGLAT